MKGYEDRNNDLWKHTRALEYMIYCALTDPRERQSIYEFRSLPGDPTKEELFNANEQLRKAKSKKWSERLKSIAKRIIEHPDKRKI